MARRPQRFGRYLVFESFARGGMATVCFGRVSGAVGFSRVVAVKRHHPHLAKDPDFVSMMVDEGRLAGRIRHPSVVPVIDLVQLPGELLLVMEYVDGISLARLWRKAVERGERVPLRISVAIIGAVLQGLHCAHEMRDERGELCGIVHRDVSPQNVIVGRDGLARLTDFGIALARERLQYTRTEEIKGKLEYMAREQLRRERVDRRTDVYAASLVLWELLTGARPFAGDTDRTVLGRISTSEVPRASSVASDIPAELDALVARGLAPAPTDRFATAFEMASELERLVSPASQLEVTRFLEHLVGDELAARAARVAEIEAYREDPVASSHDETRVGTAGDNDEGPTLARPEPSETPRGSPTLPLGGTAQAHSLPAASARSDPHHDAFARASPEQASATITAPVPSEAEPWSASDPRVAGDATPHTAIAKAEPGPTTDTRVSAVRNVTPGARSRERLVWGLPILAFVVGGGLLAVVAISRLGSHPPSDDALESSAATAQAAETGHLPSASGSEAAPVASAPVTFHPETDAEPAAQPSVAPEQPAAPRAGVPRPVSTKSKPDQPPSKPSCDPPYTVDSFGVRVPKRECFGK